MTKTAIGLVPTRGSSLGTVWEAVKTVRAIGRKANPVVSGMNSKTPAGDICVEGERVHQLRETYDGVHDAALGSDASAALISTAADEVQ